MTVEGEGYFSNLLNYGRNDLSMNDFSILPEEQQSLAEQLPVVENTSSARPNQERSKKFNEKEDALLVLAWLNISTDPVQEPIKLVVHFGWEFMTTTTQTRS